MYRSRFAFALAMAALAAILLPSSLPAQITFQRTYGGTGNDEGWSVQQTTDGGYIIAGTTASFGAGHDDIYLVKTDANGDTLWTRTFGGARDELGRSVQQTFDSGYVIAGQTWSYGGGGVDVYVIRTDAHGDTMWTRTYGGSDYNDGSSVRQTADSGYIVAGCTAPLGGYTDVYLIKTNAQGDTMWTRAYGGTGDDWGNSVQQTADGGFVVVGCTRPFGADHSDAYLIKTSAQGDTLWTKTFGGTGSEEGHAVQQTVDSGYVVAGSTYSNSVESTDVYIVKTDARGDTQWTLGGAGGDEGHSVLQTLDGGYVVAGYVETDTMLYDVYLIKTNAIGDTLWTRTFGGSYDDVGYSVQQTTDGGYVVTGVTYSFGAGMGDIYLIKTDSLGNVAVAEPKGSPTRAPALSLSCEPNPSSGTTRISIKLQASSSKSLTLRVYDAQGRLVRSFSLVSPPASLPWDGRDDRNRMLPPGAYFLRVEAGAEHATARVVLQR